MKFSSFPENISIANARKSSFFNNLFLIQSPIVKRKKKKNTKMLFWKISIIIHKFSAKQNKLAKQYGANAKINKFSTFLDAVTINLRVIAFTILAKSRALK